MNLTFHFFLIGLLTPMIAAAAVQTKVYPYQHGKVALEGFLAFNPKKSARSPGVLVVHEWKGLGEYAKKRAEQLAEMGYVALAVDMYGAGVRPSDVKEAAATSGIYKNNRGLTRERIQVALDELKKQKNVDPNQIAVIGYCFGGLVALELARSGADIKGAVSFHGTLNTPTPEDAKQIKASVLVLHGADDPYVPAEEVANFEKEMTSGRVDWQLVKYANAVHSFTSPEAGDDPSKGQAYNALADRRSWLLMQEFLKEKFAQKPSPKTK